MRDLLEPYVLYGMDDVERFLLESPEDTPKNDRCGWRRRKSFSAPLNNSSKDLAP
jgi:hypothetical protein